MTASHSNFHSRISASAFIGVILGLASTFLSCGRSSTDGSAFPPGDTLTSRSSLLTLVDHKNGVVSATVNDPWNSEAQARTYLFIDKKQSPDNVPDVKGAIVIPTPVNSALVYSSVHASVFNELGVKSLVTGVADGNYFMYKPFNELIRNGEIKDIGSSMSPSLEAIVELSPDVAVVSPYQNAGHGILDQTGIPILEMADYMETTPLGRAEWILILGALTGRLQQAEAIYKSVASQYEAIKAQSAGHSFKPKVVTDMPAFGTWYQPGGGSYISTLIRDAGGQTVTADDNTTGSLQLDEAAAFDLAANADIWIIKADHEVTEHEIANAGKLASRLKAFENKNVWVTNTSTVPYFDDVAFHPERLVREYNAIFRDATDSLSYFSRVGKVRSQSEK